MDKPERFQHIQRVARAEPRLSFRGDVLIRGIVCLAILVCFAVAGLPGGTRDAAGGSRDVMESQQDDGESAERRTEVGGTDGVGAAAMVANWCDTLEVDERIPAEIKRFEDGRLDDAYAMSLAVDVRRLVFDSASARLEALAKGQCAPFVEVTFEEAGFASPGGEPASELEREFEEAFIRTEVLACLQVDDVTPEDVLRTYTDPEFRKNVSSRIARIWSEGGDSCIETKGFRPFLESTLVCNRIDELHTEELAAQHSQVVSNPGGDDHQAVYFKESLKTFVKIPGGMALHYVNYTRTVKLGGLRKRIGRKKIADSQEDAVDELRKILKERVEDD